MACTTTFRVLPDQLSESPPHILQVAVFPTHPATFLAAGRPGKLERRVGPAWFELHHPGGGEHQGRVGGRDDPGAGPDGMASFGEIIEECFSNLLGIHIIICSISFDNLTTTAQLFNHEGHEVHEEIYIFRNGIYLEPEQKFLNHRIFVIERMVRLEQSPLDRIDCFVVPPRNDSDLEVFVQTLFAIYSTSCPSCSSW